MLLTLVERQRNPGTDMNASSECVVIEEIALVVVVAMILHLAAYLYVTG